MNDFSELESELKKLRPSQPSEALKARIDRALNESPPTVTAGVVPRRSRFQFRWSSLGLGLTAVAAVILFVFVRVDRPAKKPSTESITTAAITPSAVAPAQLIPTGLTRVVYHTRDEGLHFRSGVEQPMRRTRSLTHETVVWRNPTTGASLRVSYPSEEVSLTPVSGQ